MLDDLTRGNKDTEILFKYSFQELLRALFWITE